jgi:hypothetical protein
MPFMSDVLHCLPAATPRRPIFVVVRPTNDIHHNAYPDHHQKKECYSNVSIVIFIIFYLCNFLLSNDMLNAPM